MRVLLTRSALHNMLFRQSIEEHTKKLGVETTIIETPLLEQVAVTDSIENLQTFLRDKQIQEVIFISPSAVDFGAERIFQEIAIQRVFAVGKGTANMLKTKLAKMPGLDSKKGLSDVDVIFPRQNVGSKGLLELPEMESIENVQILIVTGSEGKPDLEEILLKRGAQVSRWECYQRQKPSALASQMTKVLENPLTYVFLHSSHAARHFLEEIPQGSLTSSTVAIVGAKSIAETMAIHGWQGSVKIADSPMPKDMFEVFKQQLI